MEEVDPAPRHDPDRPGRLRGRDALRLHLTLAAGLTVCLVGFTVETARAIEGNGLSWLYVFEWPFLGGFGIYMWWMLLTGGDRDVPPDRGSRRSDDAVGRGTAAGPGGSDASEEVAERLENWRAYVNDLESRHVPEDDLT